MSDLLDNDFHFIRKNNRFQKIKNAILLVFIIIIIASIFIQEEKYINLIIISIIVFINSYLFHTIYERINKKEYFKNRGYSIYPYKKIEIEFNSLFFGLNNLIIYADYNNSIEMIIFILGIITIVNSLFFSLIIKTKELQYISVSQQMLLSVKNKIDKVELSNSTKGLIKHNEIILHEKNDKHIIYIDELKNGNLLWDEIKININPF